jgi:hypothetical protein
MSQTLNTTIAVVGIDIGKNSFHSSRHDGRGAICCHRRSLVSGRRSLLRPSWHRLQPPWAIFSVFPVTEW